MCPDRGALPGNKTGRGQDFRWKFALYTVLLVHHVQKFRIAFRSTKLVKQKFH